MTKWQPVHNDEEGDSNDSDGDSNLSGRVDEHAKALEAIQEFMEMQHNAQQSSELSKVLEEYADVFKDPQGLHPLRHYFDHVIPLKRGTEGISLRPYRYPTMQKDVIENMTKELLDHGAIKSSWSADAKLATLIQDLQLDPKSHPQFVWCHGELRRRGRLVVGNDSTLKLCIFKWLHDSAIGDHSGSQVTIERVVDCVKQCVVCQQCKTNNVTYPGLLLPLPIPKGVWEDISMDFIEGLPMSSNKNVILVILDRLSKATHFLALQHPYSAVTVAQVFMDHIFRLHGLARCLEGYLRCMCFGHPKEWCKWLPLAEYWYNTSYHSAIKCSPFEIVYGQAPPLHLPFLSGESTNDTVDRSLLAREKRQMTVVARENKKLAAKYYDPYAVVAKIGKVAYTLQLLSGSLIHPTVHVSMLRKYHIWSCTSIRLYLFKLGRRSSCGILLS
ncbi:hypothetical protein SSX86_010555 [Deinandra increscens subsp. villosa]|uniref:Tf2-1-like SH3-like domain-containing protein n=1 Tax=Deinandra increscens subsp. villosa TaxID=3103831 RepID=A0AAP0H515_9ASTR